MFELNYNESSDVWGLQAKTADKNLEFSGNFTRARLQSRQREIIFNRSLTWALWGLVVFGLLGEGLNIYDYYLNHSFGVFFEQNIGNLAFCVGVFALLYIWARRKQTQLQEQSLTIQEYTDAEKNIDVYKLFNKDAQNAWDSAAIDTEKNIWKQVTVIHIFIAVLKTKSVALAFLRLGTNPKDIIVLLKNYLTLHPSINEDDIVRKLPFAAFMESVSLHNKSIDPLMLLCAMVRLLPEEHIIQSLFFNIGVTAEDLEILASWIFNVTLLIDDLSLFKKMSRFKPDDGINRGLTAVPTHYLDHFSRDLTFLAKHGGLPIALGREADLHEIFKLGEQGSGNILIKGAVGTGRTTVINELAYKMATEQVPKYWQDKRLIRLEISAIVGNPEHAENALLQCLHEAVRTSNILLVIEDIHQLAESRNTQGLSLLDILLDYASQHPISVLATTTVEDYSDYLQRNGNFDQNFSMYELPLLSKTQTILASCIKASLLESQYKCFFTYRAIQQAYELGNIYVKNAGQPQKTIGILVDAAHAQKGNTASVITEEVIQAVISKKTHIPMESIGENESDTLLQLEEKIGKLVIGQSQAISAVSEGIRRARSGLSSGNRPLASFLFLGPTGVGKTELAKTLAQVYFGKEEYLLRLDMSEFSGIDGVEKIIGKAGAKTDTSLIKHLKNYPFCLLLCDEFEKASSEVHNLFLQILDDGRLTSGSGEILDLTHIMVIATSNAGTVEIQDGMKAGKTSDQIRSQLFNSTLQKIFRPELLNRFDGVIIFTPLSKDEVERVAYLQLEYLRKQLREKGIKLDFTNNVLADISKNAYDPLLGGRPIRRYIQDHIEGFIAKLILSKKITRGSDLIVDLQDGKLVLK